MPKYIGIDAGSYQTPSWVAILEADGTKLDAVRFQPLDQTPLGMFLDDPDVVRVAVDAPLSLPAQGRPRRHCDEAADTPTRRLPVARRELDAGVYEDGKQMAYRAIILLGVELGYRHRDALLGLASADEARLIETYPRAIYRRLSGEWPPSKRNDPFGYMTAFRDLLATVDLQCGDLMLPSTDQADALACAFASRRFSEGTATTEGQPPEVDEDGQVVREGFIVLPTPGVDQ